jgi:hypothetical protein
MNSPIKVLVWGEYRHEKKNPKVAAIYPDGMHEAIAGFLRTQTDLEVGTAWLDQPEHGLGGDVLEHTDVLVWWGHIAHADVSDEAVAAVRKRVLEGMGLIVLHSGHYAKVFKALMGTTCSLKWRESTDKERIWNIAPHHPITAGIGRYGPFVQHNGAYANLENVDEVFEVGLNRAVTLLAEKRAGGKGRGRNEAAALKDLGAHPGDGMPVKVLSGRYGPYIKHGSTNANVPKGSDPQNLTLEEAVKLLAEREAKGGGKKKPAAKAKAPAKPKAEAKAKPKAAAKPKTEPKAKKAPAKKTASA